MNMMVLYDYVGNTGDLIFSGTTSLAPNLNMDIYDDHNKSFSGQIINSVSNNVESMRSDC